MSAGIYCITNRINLKMYIGQSVDIERRWWNEKNKFAVGSYLKRAFQKYGIQNFTFEKLVVLDKDDPDLKNKLNKLEVEYIKRYDTRNPDFGYNLSEGGGSNRGWKQSEHARATSSRVNKGKVVSQETRDKIRIAATGRVVSEETRKKQSELRKGVKRDPESVMKGALKLRGRACSEETKKKISISNSGRKLSDERKKQISKQQTGMKRPPGTGLKMSIALKGKNLNKRGKPVKCIETGVTYKSCGEAMRETGVNRIAIGQCAAGHSNSAGGRRWEWANG